MRISTPKAILHKERNFSQYRCKYLHVWHVQNNNHRGFRLTFSWDIDEVYLNTSLELADEVFRWSHLDYLNGEAITGCFHFISSQASLWTNRVRSLNVDPWRQQLVWKDFSPQIVQKNSKNNEMQRLMSYLPHFSPYSQKCRLN